MRSRNISWIVAAALCLAAGRVGIAAAGPLESELLACTLEQARQTPHYRDIYAEMQQKGFAVLSKTAEAYMMRGRPVYDYRFQITGTGKVYVIYCLG